MFKKPKRNFRSRRKDSESGDEHAGSEKNPVYVIGDQENSSSPVIPVKKAKKKKKEKDKDGKTSVLSFDHDEHDEEGAEFKIKKSSHSKKIAKQLKKELQKEKEEREQMEKDKKKQKEEKVNSYSTDHLKALMDQQKAQNGLVDDYQAKQEDKEEEEEEEDKTDPLLDFVRSGAIPDAATIHAIRKKRQLAREQTDFVPLEETEKYENEKSRLIREEDHDHSDNEDEEGTRIAMGINQRDQQLRKMQQTILMANEEDKSLSDHEWEEQQIRRVHKPAVQSSNGQDMSPQTLRQYGYSNQVTDMEVEDIGSTRKVPPVELPQVSMDSLIKRLKENLLEASTVHRVHVHERDDVCSRLETAQEEIANSDGNKARLENQYTFFQEMRGYVQDLVDCLSHKVLAIDHLERSMMKQYQKYADQFVKRRQQDIKDESQDALKMKTPGGLEPPPPDPDKQRRIAEREARRGRRKRKRDAFQIRDHEDGMSTDDELKPSEISSLNSEKERITTECQRLFEDVVEDFHQFRPIMNQFERWKREHAESYNEAYIGLCLPKLFSPLIRLRLVTWNPLEAKCRDFEEMSWYESLIFYGHREGHREQVDRHDSDLKLMPSIIEKVLLPKLTEFIETVWDPLSTQQTSRLVNLTKRLIKDYPTVNADNKNTKLLVKALVDRIRKTLDDDVFMPLYPKPILEANKSAANFFERQFWQCVKLLDNILKWHNVISEKPLQELALDGLLNRYIILALQNSTVNQRSIYACQVIISSFPSEWFTSVNDDSIAGLQSLCRFLYNTAVTLDTQASGKGEAKRKQSRDQIKQLAKLLTQIHATDSALTLSEKFNFKLGQL